MAQLRHIEAQKRRTAKQVLVSAPRRRPKYVRLLFIWGFIGTNVAISIAWARAADEAAATGMTRLSNALLRLAFMRAPGGLIYMAENLTLTARSLRQGRWWTLLTHGVSHAAPAHLIVNMCGFYTWASRCFDLGLGPRSVAGLILGSTVCCGVAGLANEPAWRPSMHMGASGLVSGLSESSVSLVVTVTFSFYCLATALCVACTGHNPPAVARLVDSKIMAGAAAILLEPVMGFRVPGVCDVRWPIFTTIVMGLGTDLIGVLSQRRVPTDLSMTKWGPRSVSKNLVGYAGHLGGAAFGVAYWYFCLRSRSARGDPTGLIWKW